jgi:hypothetical protein
MNRFLLYSSLFYFPNIWLFARRFIVFAGIRSGNRESPFYSNQKNIPLIPLNSIRPVMSDLQNRRFMINYMKDIECISQFRLSFLSKSMQIAISLNDSKARDQAALNLASIMGTLGCTKRLPTFCKTLAIGPQS